MNITQNTLTLLLQVASPFPPKGRVRGGNLEEGGKGKVAFPTPPCPPLPLPYPSPTPPLRGRGGVGEG